MEVAIPAQITEYDFRRVSPAFLASYAVIGPNIDKHIVAIVTESHFTASMFVKFIDL